MSLTARILTTLEEIPSTSYEVAAELDIPLPRACAMLRYMAEEGYIYRSKEKVRLRHRSPGAFMYSTQPFTTAAHA